MTDKTAQVFPSPSHCRSPSFPFFLPNHQPAVLSVLIIPPHDKNFCRQRLFLRPPKASLTSPHLTIKSPCWSGAKCLGPFPNQPQLSFSRESSSSSSTSTSNRHTLPSSSHSPRNYRNKGCSILACSVPSSPILPHQTHIHPTASSRCRPPVLRTDSWRSTRLCKRRSGSTLR